MPTVPLRDKLAVPALCLSLVSAIVIAYEPIRHNWFIRRDDFEYVTENPNVNGGIAARYLLVALLFSLGLMAKPILAALPFCLLLLDYRPLKRLGFADAAGHRPGPPPGSSHALGLQKSSPLSQPLRYCSRSSSAHALRFAIGGIPPHSAPIPSPYQLPLPTALPIRPFRT